MLRKFNLRFVLLDYLYIYTNLNKIENNQFPERREIEL